MLWGKQNRISTLSRRTQYTPDKKEENRETIIDRSSIIIVPRNTPSNNTSPVTTLKMNESNKSATNTPLNTRATTQPVIEYPKESNPFGDDDFTDEENNKNNSSEKLTDNKVSNRLEIPSQQPSQALKKVEQSTPVKSQAKNKAPTEYDNQTFKLNDQINLKSPYVLYDNLNSHLTNDANANYDNTNAILINKANEKKSAYYDNLHFKINKNKNHAKRISINQPNNQNNATNINNNDNNTNLNTNDCLSLANNNDTKCNCKFLVISVP